LTSLAGRQVSKDPTPLISKINNRNCRLHKADSTVVAVA